MISFNFIETSFFISLGITFVLILLLIYHFKQRLHITESKQDTMFEIINNLAQELSSIKEFTMMRCRPIPSNAMNHIVNSCFTSNNELISNPDEIVVDDTESDDGESDDGESEDEESDDGESEEFDHTNNIEKIIVSDADDNISVESIKIETTDIIEIKDIKQELSEKHNDKNYTKKTLGELKSFIVEKGWVADASKMKKNQIIEMIETRNA